MYLFIGEKRQLSPQGLIPQENAVPKHSPKIEPNFFLLDKTGTNWTMESCSAITVHALNINVATVSFLAKY